MSDEELPHEERPEPEDLRYGGQYRPDVHRLLPQSPDAEKGLLSSFMLSPNEVYEIIERHQIDGSKFHIPAHGVILDQMVEIYKKKKHVDFILLTEWLRDRKKLDEAGGAAYVTELFTFLPTAANVHYYREIIEEKATLREIIRVGTEYAARSYDEQDNVPYLLDEFEQHVMRIAANRTYGDEEVSSSAAVMQAIANIERLQQAKGTTTGLPTGYSDLDRTTDGLHGGEMIVIAARPSMGKTSIAMNIAEHVALELKQHVAIFSMEMPTHQLTQRMILSRARVDTQRLRMGWGDQDRDHRAITHAATEIGSSPCFHFFDRSGISVPYIRAICRRLHRKYGLAAIFIDYLQLLRGTKHYKGDNRQLEIADISAGLKEMAKELGIPVVVLAQLNRSNEKRGGDWRPRLSDIRESGAIEQDADVIAFLHREEYYLTDEVEKREAEGKATLIIAKQRNGPVGDVDLTFLKEFTRFETRARGGEPA